MQEVVGLPETVSGAHRSASGRAPRPVCLPSADEVLGRMGGENFPVALRFLPSQTRDRLRAIYGYARFVDQLGDAYPGDRLAALDWLEGELDRGLCGDRPPSDLHPLVGPAVALVTEHGASDEDLRALVGANRMDQEVSAHRSFPDLVAYCRLSADPVGHLVLAAFGQSTPERVVWSDRICTALQLVEHWQDLAEDVRSGRVYLPGEDLARFGVDRAELVATADRGGPAGPALRGLVAFEAHRARSLLEEGEPLIGALTGWARVAVTGFVAGGHAALDALAASGFDPFAGAPRPPRRRGLPHAAGPTARAGRPASSARARRSASSAGASSRSPAGAPR